MNKQPIYTNTQTHTLQLPPLLLDSSRSTRCTRRRGRKRKGREMVMVGASLSLPPSLSPPLSPFSPLCRRREGFSSLHQHHHQQPSLLNHKVQVPLLHLLPVPRIQMLFPRRDGGFMGVHATNPKLEIVDSYTAGSGARDPKVKDWLMPLLLMALAGAAIVTVVLTSRTNGAWVTFGERLNHGSSSNDAALFTLNLFGVKVNLAERTPGWAYFWLLMAAGFGLFVSEEALNVWVGATLARLLIFDGTWGSFLLSFQQNYQYIISTVLWVYWGVCISDMVPFYVGKFASNTKSSDKLREKIGVSKEKLDHIKDTVQRYGNLIGFVERFSIGVRNPTSFLAGAVGISPSRFFTGVCLGGLITLPVQLGIGCALRDRPIVALAGVAAVMGLWTILPYVVAGFASMFYIIRKKNVK